MNGRRAKGILTNASPLIAMMAIAMSSSSAIAQSVDYGSLEQLFGEPVTTSATGLPQRTTEVPANMEIVTAEDIRRSGATDIPGILNHVLGVDVMRWTSADADVGVHGYNQAFSPRLLVLIDGRQVYADYYGYTPWNALPVELGAIRQIEVVKGPNAALFGFNAVSGVINIITYNPLYDKVNAVSASFGTQRLAQGSLVQTLRVNDRTAFRLSLGGRRNDNFSTPVPASSGTRLSNPQDHFAFDVLAMTRLADGVQLRLEATHSGGGVSEVNPAYLFADDEHSASSVKGELTADTRIGLLRATAYNNWSHQRELIATLAPLVFDERVTVAQLEDVFRLGPSHTFRVSAEYRHNTLNTTPFVGASVFYDVFSGGGMWNWALTPTLSLTNALRFDDLKLGRSGLTPPGYPLTNADWKRSAEQWSFNSGLVWAASRADTLRLLVSRGVQLPSLTNYGGLLIATPFLNLTGVPSLEPALVTNYEIDWDHALPGIGGKFKAALFYKHTENIIANSDGLPIPGPTFSSPANIGNSDAHGFELALTGTIHKHWRWGVNYRYEAIDDDLDSVHLTLSDFEHVTPEHVVKANLGWSDRKWEIDAYLYYQSATDGIVTLPFGQGGALTPVPGYANMDARIAYRLADWATLAVAGQNLLTSVQQQTSGPAVERRVIATLSINY